MSDTPSELVLLRSRLGVAVRCGRTDEAREIETALAVGVLERDIKLRLDGATLSAEQADRLITAINERRDRFELEAEVLARASEAAALVEALRACSEDALVRTT